MKLKIGLKFELTIILKNELEIELKRRLNTIKNIMGATEAAP